MTDHTLVLPTSLGKRTRAAIVAALDAGDDARRRLHAMRCEAPVVPIDDACAGLAMLCGKYRARWDRRDDVRDTLRRCLERRGDGAIGTNSLLQTIVHIDGECSALEDALHVAVTVVATAMGRVPPSLVLSRRDLDQLRNAAWQAQAVRAYLTSLPEATP